MTFAIRICLSSHFLWRDFESVLQSFTKSYTGQTKEERRAQISSTKVTVSSQSCEKCSRQLCQLIESSRDDGGRCHCVFDGLDLLNAFVMAVRSGELPSFRGHHGVGSNGSSRTASPPPNSNHSSPFSSSPPSLQKEHGNFGMSFRKRWWSSLRRCFKPRGYSFKSRVVLSLILCGSLLLAQGMLDFESRSSIPCPPRILLMGDSPWIAVSPVVPRRLPPPGRRVRMEIHHQSLPDETYYAKTAATGDNYTSQCPFIVDWPTDAPHTCNLQHEFAFEFRELSLSTNHRLEYIASGAIKDVWRVVGQSVVLKTTAYKCDFSMKYLYKNRRDALVMDASSASPYVLNMYSYCAFSNIVEAAHGTARDWLRDYSGSDDSEGERGYDPKLHPPPAALLRVATRMALALRDVHLFTNSGLPTFAHADIKSTQFLITSQPGDPDHPVLKLNDFNRGRFLSATNEGKLCPFYIASNHRGSKHRAPEEYMSRGPQTDKIDVFSLGSTFYEILTGYPPFYEIDDYKDVIYKITTGVPPSLPAYLENSTDPSLQAVIKAMTLCRQFRAEDRQDSRLIADFLQQALQVAKLENKT